MKPMQLTETHRKWILSFLIAFAITLFVNFSFLLYATDVNVRRYKPMLEYYIWAQLCYYFLVSYILVAINMHAKSRFGRKIIYTVLVSVFLYVVAPTVNREGEWLIQWSSHRFYDPMLIMKFSFILIVAVLYGKIFELIYQKQHIIIENEQLKNENLQTRYNMLANQISPHFLFNSLNSLSMLVRESLNDKALLYIDNMSDTFRYMLQSGQSEITTLGDELKFMTDYLYMHTIRYENKLFFEIEVDATYLDWTLPSMSLQPLIENAVKHNSISLSKPFHIRVSVENDKLMVSNPLQPKLDKVEGTEIGLKNLSSRYQLLIGEDIEVINDGVQFCVILPLIKPEV